MVVRFSYIFLDLDSFSFELRILPFTGDARRVYESGSGDGKQDYITMMS